MVYLKYGSEVIWPLKPKGHHSINHIRLSKVSISVCYKVHYSSIFEIFEVEQYRYLEIDQAIGVIHLHANLDPRAGLSFCR